MIRDKDIGLRATRGMAMFIAQSFGLKLLTSGSNLILAALLVPEIFGLFATVLAVSELASVIKKFGVREVLIRRRRVIDRWASAGFWLTLVLGVGGAISVVLLGPFMISNEHRQELVVPLLLFAAIVPLQTVKAVPAALLQRSMRFGPMVGVHSAALAIQASLSIVLAWVGFGIYALVFPRLLTEVIELVGYWLFAKPRILIRFDGALWRSFMRSGVPMSVAAIADSITMFGDYYIVGKFVPKELVGAYFLAFALSTQVSQLLIENLSKVLLPGLSALQHDPERQARAFVRSTRLLAVLSVPACLLIAGAADPVMRILYADKWVEAIPLLQVLAIGAITAIAGAPAVNMLHARGLYVTHMWFSVLRAICIVVFVTIGAWQFGAVGAAAGVLLARFVVNPLMYLVAARPAGVGVSSLWGVFGLPMLLGGVAVAAGLGLAALVPVSWMGTGRWLHAVRLVAISAGASIIYVALVWWLQRSVWNELMYRIGMLLPESARLRFLNNKFSS